MCDRDTEDRPLTCGDCTWRGDGNRCVHGNGPRTGEFVALDQLSCFLGRGKNAFCTDPTLLDMTEEELEKHLSMPTLVKLGEAVNKEYRAWLRKQRQNKKPQLRLVKDDPE
jgi:hypothetical protein